MLILIGTVSTAYASNHSVGKNQVEVFVSDAARAVSAGAPWRLRRSPAMRIRF